MGQQLMTGLISALGGACIKILVNDRYQVSVAFNEDGDPDGIVIFVKENPSDTEYRKNVTDEVLGDEAYGGRITFDSLEDVLSAVKAVTKEEPIAEVSMGLVKRELVAIGTKLALAEVAIGDTMRRPAPAFKAKRAKLSVIDAIVEVGHILDGGIDNIKV
jgi:hypothetical protein